MATSNAATTYLERRVIDYLFKNDSLSFATPGNSIYVGLATAVTSAENGNITEVQVDTDDANYTRKQVQAADWKQSVTTVAVTFAQGATALILTDAESFPVSGTVTIDDEIVTYTAKDTTAAANVNGAVSSSANVAVDGNAGTITVGMVVTGTGISGTVRVATVTSQSAIVLSSAVTLADDTALNFDGTNTLTGCTRGASSTTDYAHNAGVTVVCDTQRVINDNNIEYAAAAGTAASYTVTHAFVADKNIATANVNGATSSSTAVAVDGNVGTIAVGDIVTGSGITGATSGVVRVATVTSQASIALDTAVSLANDAVLTFDGSNILFVGALDASKTLAIGDIFRINAGNLSVELK
jgi:ribosomal 30S subunit maturation factor RimM